MFGTTASKQIVTSSPRKWSWKPSDKTKQFWEKVRNETKDRKYKNGQIKNYGWWSGDKKRCKTYARSLEKKLENCKNNETTLRMKLDRMTPISSSSIDGGKRSSKRSLKKSPKKSRKSPKKRSSCSGGWY